MASDARSPVVVWFRRDLRMRDHHGLAGADGPVVPLFVLDPALQAAVGERRRQRLAAALRSLDGNLRAAGGHGLVLRTGDPARVVTEVAAEAGARDVRCATEVGGYAGRRDDAVARALAGAGGELIESDSPFLHAPGVVQRGDGGPYSVFTPYFRAWSALPTPAPVRADPPAWAAALPSEPLPDAGPATGGEREALKRLERFADGGLSYYDTARDRPDLDGTSGLSAALHFGEIHPRTVVAVARRAGGEGAAAFVRQVAWRDFAGETLARRPDAPRANIDARFAAFPWFDGSGADGLFADWCAGRTGYPFVDAGMRQLASTGWMHNRTRMVVASFLVKDLLLDWRLGAAYFMQQLLDADVANNTFGWQWTAGTGIDPAPYHRIFNPVLQGQRFDPEGDYVRRFVPELAHLPGKLANEPWSAPGGYDHGYPPRIVDHAQARAEALLAFNTVTGR